MRLSAALGKAHELLNTAENCVVNGKHGSYIFAIVKREVGGCLVNNFDSLKLVSPFTTDAVMVGFRAVFTKLDATSAATAKKERADVIAWCKARIKALESKLSANFKKRQRMAYKSIHSRL